MKKNHSNLVKKYLEIVIISENKYLKICKHVCSNYGRKINTSDLLLMACSNLPNSNYKLLVILTNEAYLVIKKQSIAKKRK